MTEERTVESEFRWIPCSEKLPEKYGCYRVTIEDVDGGRYSDFRWFATEIGFEVHGDKVVAWKPAPKPYMGEQMNINYKNNEMYQEIELFDEDIKIGEAEIEIYSKMLSRLAIYEPYQDKGYGTAVVKMLIRDYGINCLWVNADNTKAMHVYEKCGFVKMGPTMYLMRRHV